MVLAQGETRLSIQPADSSVAVGGSTTVTVDVSNGSDLNAYDITIVYNSGVITLSTWSHGTYFSNLAVLINENQPGRLRLVATQLATAGKSGNGTMLNLVFQGAAPGSSSVSIQSIQMSTSSSETVIPGVSDGWVQVLALPTATFTKTFTPTASLTPTFTKTPTRTLTPTRTMTPTPTRTPTPTATSIYALTSTSTVPGMPTVRPGATNTLPAAAATVTPSTGQTPAPQVSQSKSGLIYPSGTPNSPVKTAALEPTVTVTTASGEGSSAARLNTLLWVLTILLIVILAAIIIYHAARRNEV